MEETIQTKEAAAAAPPADDVGATARARARPARPQAPWQTSWFQEQAKAQARSPSHRPPPLQPRPNALLLLFPPL